MPVYFWSSTSSTDPTLGANWTRSDGTTGTPPGNGDDVFVQAIAGLSLSSIGAADMGGVTLNSLSIGQSFTGTIGTASPSAAPFGYWKIGAATVTIGSASGDGVDYGGSGRIKLNLGSAAFSATVVNTGVSIDAGVEPVRILAGNSASRLSVLGGRVGIATSLPGETATLGEIDVSGATALCNAGPGTTWSTANVSAGGWLNLNGGGSGTVSVGAGATLATSGNAAIATINAGGTVVLSHRPASGAAVTTLNLLPGGTADFSQNPAAVAVTTLNHHAGGVLSANPANPSHLSVNTRNLVNCGTLTAS